MKIALLIPTTSYRRDEWKYVVQSYLYNLTIKTFIETYDTEHEYRFYIGIDKKDRIFDDKKSKERIEKLFTGKNVSVEFIYMSDCKKGHLTAMWNILFKKAYDDGFDYFFQCGDDISFKTKGWVNDCIRVLEEHNNIGLTGPINNNPVILTQAFVSRKHMEIFGWFFPEEIINWGCDDWYNEVYKPDYFFPLKNHYCSNDGGVPRYQINNDPMYEYNMQLNTMKLRTDVSILANNHKNKIIEYKMNMI